jgi:replication factor C subunit 3/5
MLWVDRHRPKALSELDLHPDITSMLTHLAAASTDMPHLLFYGPSGSGKKTRAMALLNDIFGSSVYNLKLEHKAVQVTDAKTIEMTSLSSQHHIDINPSDAGSYDRVIVMQMIREIAQTALLNTTGPRFKVVILNEVDKLTRGAQQALRRTMEKYMETCRLVLICTSTSRLIAPLRSRCLGVRVPAHSLSNVTTAVQALCLKEAVALPSPAFLATLHVRSDGNLRRALLMLEAAKMMKADFAGTGAADIPVPDWKMYLQEISQEILREQTPQKLHEVRLKYYELLGQCVPGEIILRELLLLLLAAVVPHQRRPILAAAAEFDHNMKLGTKPIMHLEAFTAAAMKAIKAG